MLVNDDAWDRDLDNEEKLWIDRQYNRMLKSVDEYGIGSPSTCKRLRRNPEEFYVFNQNSDGTQIIEGAPCKLTSYWISFVYKHGGFPKKGHYVTRRQRFIYGEMSHLCGNRNCINPDHIVFESPRINRQRKRCHRIIRQYEEAYRGGRNRTTVKGAITVGTVRLKGGKWAKKNCQGAYDNPVTIIIQ